MSAAAKAVQAAWMKVVMGEAENGKPAVVAKATDAKDAEDTDAGDATQAEGAATKAADAAPADSGAAQEDKGTVAAKGGEELIPTGDDKRDRLRTLLAGKLALADRVAGDEWTPHGAAAKIEEALHKLHGGDVKALSTKYRAIAVNIGDPKNPDFRRKILRCAGATALVRVHADARARAPHVQSANALMHHVVMRSLAQSPAPLFPQWQNPRRGCAAIEQRGHGK